MHSNGQHHLHLRNRIYKGFQQYPHPDSFKRGFDRVMVFIAIVGPAATIPQVLDVFSSQDVSGLSLTTWSLWLVLSGFWAAYGFVHKEMPIFISNLAYIVLQGIIVVAIVSYQ